MKRILVALALLTSFLSIPAFAQVPRTMSYQGVLTDNAGNLLPDGLYDITFRLYNVPVAGAALYAEAHNGANQVPLRKGGFSVILGSLAPLGLPFDGPYYLGIQVGAAPELAPRIALASSPYALGLALPFQCTTTAGIPFLEGIDFGIGGAFHANNSAGQLGTRIEPDANGGGAGFFQVTRNGQYTTNGFLVDGNTGAGEPAIYLAGSARMVTMDMGVVGDGSVTLPNDAISAPEILDEPGIAQGHVNGSVNVPSGGVMADIVTVTLAIPAPGYIVVEADGQHRFDGNGTTYLYGNFQIDETAGGGNDFAHWFVSGKNPATGESYQVVSVRRTYFKAAGSYTFRFEGHADNPGAFTDYVWNPTITATYYPTSYGAVTTSPTLAETGQFAKVERTDTRGGPQSGGVGALVDLRELELKAARARTAALSAERDLLEARVSAQSRAGKGR